MLKLLNERAQAVLNMIVEEYVDTGEPLGSQSISRRLEEKLSSATVRNVLMDLQSAGLIHAPHASAGRLPTHSGLRLFVEGILESGDLAEGDRKAIEDERLDDSLSVGDLLSRAVQMMAGLSRCAGLVAVPKGDLILKHIEFVPLSMRKVIAVIVMQGGMIENVVLDMPLGIPMTALIEAGNYLSSKMSGYPLQRAIGEIHKDIGEQRALLREKTQAVVDSGLAVLAERQAEQDILLVVGGRDNLLEHVSGMEDLEAVRSLFAVLESKENVLKVLESLDDGEGVRIFIGSDNELFSLSGCSLIASSYRGSDSRVVGTVGVIGPSRMNYARIIPLVDYTTKVIDRIMKQV